MEHTVLQIAQRADYRQLAEWLVRQSQAPKEHCLHTWSGQSAAELHRQLLSYWDDSELCYVLAWRDGQLVGAMGAEYDEELRRGWLHGPHAAVADWEPVAAILYTRLLAALPVCIRQLDAYLNVENTRGRRFHAQRDFSEQDHLGYDFWLTPDQRVLFGERGGVPLGEEHKASFEQLYQALFPGAYYGAERVIQMIGRSHQVVVAAEGRDVVGFVVTSAPEDQSTAEIQFVGVREDRRRQGYGRRLLLSAVDWLFDSAEVSRITLTVGEELAGARGLYESVGFKLRFTGVGLRKTLARSGD